MDKPRLRILRGIHTSSEVGSLVAELQDVDVIFLESLGSVSTAKGTFTAANALSTNQEYIDYFQANAFKEGILSFALHLAWALRGRGKSFYQVDYIWKDDTPPEEYQARIFMMEFEARLQKIADNHEQRYQIMNEWLAHEIENIRWRDRLVAAQIKRLLEKDSGSMWRENDGTKGVHTFALCVGLMHNPMPLLLQQLPNFDITESMYAEDSAKKLLREDTVLQMLWKKKRHPGQPLTEKEIDYGLYGLLLRASLDPGPAEEKISMEEHAIKGIDRGFANDPALKRLETVAGQLKPIDAYEPGELRRLVDDLLSEEAE